MTGEARRLRGLLRPVVRWVVLGETAGYQHMDEDVESLQCYCGRN